MPRWGMVVDLKKCIGCETCKQVCYEANQVPPGATWRRITEIRIEGNPKSEQVYLTMGCMHCTHPPCLEVCPTGATYQRPDGIVDIRTERCMGCGACVLACPYKARSINFEDKIITSEKDVGNQNKKQKKSNRIGICTKCDFCISRLEDGLKKGLQPGSDPEATPVCVRYCIGEALYFGDLDDPESEVSILIHRNKTVRLNEELKTDPSVFYILE